MELLAFIIPVCILLGAGFLFSFLWATKSGQYDDLVTPAYRILLDDQNINDNNNKERGHKNGGEIEQPDTAN